MDFIDSLTNLLDDGCHLGLLHGLGAFELMEELSSCSYFQDDVDVGLVIEVAVHLDDVGMV